MSTKDEWKWVREYKQKKVPYEDKKSLTQKLKESQFLTQTFFQMLTQEQVHTIPLQIIDLYEKHTSISKDRNCIRIKKEKRLTELLTTQKHIISLGGVITLDMDKEITTLKEELQEID